MSRRHPNGKAGITSKTCSRSTIRIGNARHSGQRPRDDDRAGSWQPRTLPKGTDASPFDPKGLDSRKRICSIFAKVVLSTSRGTMRRRQFGAVAIGAITAWPLALAAQQPARVWRIGFMAHRYEKFYDPLFLGLRELGYLEGQNLIVERRYAEGNAEHFKEFAAEMVRLNVDAIIVVTTPAAMAARYETKKIPIVHPPAIDPVGTGLSASLAHPGGNVTGLAVLNAETSAKRVELLREVVPGLSNGVV